MICAPQSLKTYEPLQERLLELLVVSEEQSLVEL